MCSKLTIIFKITIVFYYWLILSVAYMSVIKKELTDQKKLMYSKEIWYDEVLNACQFSEVLFCMMLKHAKQVSGSKHTNTHTDKHKK